MSRSPRGFENQRRRARGSNPALESTKPSAHNYVLLAPAVVLHGCGALRVRKWATLWARAPPPAGTPHPLRGSSYATARSRRLRAVETPFPDHRSPRSQPRVLGNSSNGGRGRGRGGGGGPRRLWETDGVVEVQVVADGIGAGAGAGAEQKGTAASSACRLAWRRWEKNCL